MRDYAKAKEAQKAGTAEMSERFRETGGEIEVPIKPQFARDYTRREKQPNTGWWSWATLPRRGGGKL